MAEKDQKMIDAVEQRLIDRYKTGAMISDIDFLAGAMTGVLATHDTGDMGIFPVSWTLQAMSGRSLVTYAMSRAGKHSKKELEKIEASEDLRHRTMYHSEEMLRMLRQIVRMRESNPAYVRELVRDLLEGLGLEEDR